MLGRMGGSGHIGSLALAVPWAEPTFPVEARVALPGWLLMCGYLHMAWEGLSASSLVGLFL